MKRFISVAAALAIVVVAAVAILASGEVLSFSAPGADVSVGDRGTGGSSSATRLLRRSYFALLFWDRTLCVKYIVTLLLLNVSVLILTASYLRCLQKLDLHSQMAGTPTRVPFIEPVVFNYCWGSITRRPSPTQPTATPEPTATLEATATALPPGVTPEPTATSAPQATATPEPDACQLETPALFVLPLTLTGSWVEECVYPFEIEDAAEGDRYYRWVRFVPALGNTSWTATLTSEEDTYMLLYEWDSENEEFVFVADNDDIVQGNTNSRIEWTPVLGRSYILDLTTYNADTLGDFTLTIEAGTASMQGSTEEQSIGQSDLQGAMPFERRQ